MNPTSLSVGTGFDQEMIAIIESTRAEFEPRALKHLGGGAPNKLFRGDAHKKRADDVSCSSYFCTPAGHGERT